MEKTEQRFMSFTEAGQRIGASRPMLYKLIDQGEISTARVGRSRRITSDSLEAFMARCIERGHKPSDAA